MAHPIRPPPAPTLYLLGFTCYPSDREYSEAQRATGNTIPYWFKERLVYEDLGAKPHTWKVTTGVPKSDMAGTQVHEENSQTVKVQAEEKKERVDDTLTETTNKKKAKANKQGARRAPVPCPKKKITIPLPGKRVRFAGGASALSKRRLIAHASVSSPARKKIVLRGNKKEETWIDQQEDAETRRLLQNDTLSSPPPPISHPADTLSSPVSRQETQTASPSPPQSLAHPEHEVNISIGSTSSV
jgi:hypothetical protein